MDVEGLLRVSQVSDVRGKTIDTGIQLTVERKDKHCIPAGVFALHCHSNLKNTYPSIFNYCALPMYVLKTTRWEC